MKDIKKLILLTIIVIVFIIIILLFLILNNGNMGYNKGDTYGEPIAEEVYKQRNLEIVNNSNMYYTVVNCINRYLHDCSTEVPTGTSVTAQEEASLTEEQRKTRIYEELSVEYIQENNITVENVREYVHTAEKYLSFYPISMNELSSESNNMISNYGAYGRVKDSGTGSFIGEAYIIVTIDLNNNTFAIKPCKDSNIKSIDELDLETSITSIEINSNNEFTYQRVTDEILLNNYISTFKMYALYNPDIAYNYLDDEYKQKRFGSLEKFTEYVNENKDTTLKIKLDKFQKTIEDDYTQYVCIDTNGNYYIFRETATMQFTLMLDTYTVDLPEFRKKYNSGKEETKVGMNIEKIIQALNVKDYEYVYGKMSDGFKNNYFQTLDSFKEYAKQNFYDINDIEYQKFDFQGSNYMFEVQIKDVKSNASTNRTIFMQLKSGTDFVFSFSV